jgi:hypothetical protein
MAAAAHCRQVSAVLGASLLIFGLAVSVAAQEELISIEIRGTVSTDDGEKLVGSEIEMRFTRITEEESGLTRQSDERVAVTTDASGSYSIKLNIGRDWSNYILRVNASRLDKIHYVQPRDRMLTELIRAGLESGTYAFEVNWLIESRPRWRELRTRIDSYGADTEQSRLLREYGLPEHEQEFRADDRVINIWYYYTQGFAVRFVNGVRDKEFRFRPRKPPQR